MAKEEIGFSRRKRTSVPVIVLVALLSLAAVAPFSGCDREASATGGDARPSAFPPSLPDLSGEPSYLRERLIAAHEAVVARPGEPEPLQLLARTYHANDYPERAEACWLELRRRFPSEAKWHYYLADIWLNAGHIDEAVQALHGTLKRSPQYAPAWLRLGNVLLKTGDNEGARKAFAARLRLVPADPYATIGLARLDARAGARSTAKSLLEASIAKYPNFPTTRSLYSTLLAEEGDEAAAARERAATAAAGRFWEADDPWLDSLANDCHRFDRLVTLADVHLQTRRGDMGRALAEHAISLEPQRTLGYGVLAKIHARTGQTELALKTYTDGLGRTGADQPDAVFYFDYSLLLLSIGQREEALRVAERGLGAHSGSYELYNARGEALAELGRVPEAIESFNEAIQLNPNDPNSHYNLAVAYRMIGRKKESLQALQSVLQVQPSHQAALLNATAGMLELGLVQEAEPHVRALRSFYPDFPPARALHSRWRLAAGVEAERVQDTDTAEQHYREGLATAPDAPELHGRLGELLLMGGRVDEALPHLQRHQQLRPDLPHAYLTLGQAFARTGQLSRAREALMKGRELARQAGQSSRVTIFDEILNSLPPG